MDWLKRFFLSNIGLKILMAASGVALVGFVIAHMAGNLQVFLGARAFNHYSELLQGQKELVLFLRLGLLGAAVSHVWAAITLITRGRQARPVGYGVSVFMGERAAVRFMRFGGITLLAFIVFHLLHMTTGHVHVSGEPGVMFEPCAVINDDFTCFAYQNLVSGLKVWYVALFYVVANVFLGLHLIHGVWSAFRTLGLSNPRWDAIARFTANAIAIAVGGGNIAITLAILFGIVHL